MGAEISQFCQNISKNIKLAHKYQSRETKSVLKLHHQPLAYFLGSFDAIVCFSLVLFVKVKFADIHRFF